MAEPSPEPWLFYRVANAGLHVLHVSVIMFALTGWIWCGTRALHLVMIGLIFSSWVLLMPFKGFGYCAITDLQWKLKAKAGVPVPNGGYMRFLYSRLLHQDFDEGRVDAVTYSVMLLCCVGSVWLSLIRGFC